MKPKYLGNAFTLICISLLTYTACIAQQDTLTIMAYNVLHYGDGCQGSNSYLHSQLKTIVKYADPDILGLVKAQSINGIPSHSCGASPLGFADSIETNALNAAFPGQYNYAALTNQSCSNDMDILFYNQNKLGSVSVTILSTNQEDFDLYKLYYKDPFLSITHDSTFLYVILNHTVSGSASAQRDHQDSININKLKSTFYHLPNLISMGDFNTRSSLEPGYVLYTQTADTSFLFDDPPFHPDNKLTYPLNWLSNPVPCESDLNVSTRQFSIPNSCGDNGGAYDWYEHIFMSQWLTNNINFIHYIKNSYQTIGNDGNRLGISINDSTSHGKNLSAPLNVLNAIFNLSDKYPIISKFAVTYDSLGNGPANPIINAVTNVVETINNIRITNPVTDHLTIYFPSNMIGEKGTFALYDICGRLLNSEEISITSSELTKQLNLSSGIYILRLTIGQHISIHRIVKN
jgi:hypothetical protein